MTKTRKTAKRRKKPSRKGGDKKEKEEKMAFLKSIFNAITDGITVLDRNCSIIYINHSLTHFYGYKKPKDIIGKKCYEIFQNRKRKCKQCPANDVFEKGKPRHLVRSKKDSHGNESYWELYFYPIFDHKGKVIRVVEYSKNISEEKKAKEALRESEEQIRLANERLRYLLTSTSAVIYTAKSSGNYGATFVSENVTQMAGFESKEFLGKSNFWIDHVHPEDKKRVQKEVSRLLKKGHHAYEYRFKNKKGKYIWVRDEMELIRDKDGKPLEIVGFWVDITNRKRAEAETKKLQKELETIFNSDPTAIWYKDNNNKILRVNQTGADALGMKIEDVEGKPVKELFPKTDADHYYDDDLEVIDSGKPKINIIERMQTVTGDKRWVRTDKIPYRDENENIIGIIAFIRDITEQKNMEESLRESEEKYRNLFHESNDAIIIHDLKGKIMDVNQRVLDLFGFSKKEILALKIPKLHPPYELERSKKAFKKISKKGHVYFEIDFKKKTGEIFPAELSSNLFEIGDKKVIQGIVRDITERRKAEEALKESEEMYRALIDTSPDTVTATDLEGNITYVSKRTLELHGYTKPKDLLGKNAFELIAPEDHERAMKYLQKTLKKGVTRNLEYTFLRKDGSRFIGELNAALIKDASGNPKTFIATTRDI
ncbi:MAG: PAS domain S-box protein, partial [Thermoplasmata archaeon]